MANKKHYFSLLVGLVLLTASCTEKIVLDLPEGRKVPVVEGSITNELKRHEVILSYSTDLYNTTGVEMISGAVVYVSSHGDTIRHCDDTC